MGMSDLISRQDAIEAICNEILYFSDMELAEAYDIAKKAVADIPSAQPEIIRCKDCKNRFIVNTCPHSGYFIYNGQVEVYCNARDDDFCSRGERKEE